MHYRLLKGIFFSFCQRTRWIGRKFHEQLPTTAFYFEIATQSSKTKMLVFVSIMQECSHCCQRSVTAKVNLIGWSEPSVGKYSLKYKKKFKSVKPQFKIGVLFEVTACTTNKACFT